MKGKLIVIEGTDCSGKETQSKMLIDKLNNDGEKTIYKCFPNYESSTGKIIGLPYLGKSYLAEELINSIVPNIKDKLSVYARNSKHDNLIVDIVIEEVIKNLSHGWFKEGAPNVDPVVSSLFYAADRKYNIDAILEELDKGTNIVLDRYVYSNMAHQGGKLLNIEERKKMYKFINDLEFDLLGLPQSDKRIFLYMPYEYAQMLSANRIEAKDENEMNTEFQKNSVASYLEVADIYNFDIVNCVENNSIRSREEIHKDVLTKVKGK